APVPAPVGRRRGSRRRRGKQFSCRSAWFGSFSLEVVRGARNGTLRRSAISFKSIGAMMAIRANDFRKLDLNLLVAFQVLVREKSVSRAAARLFLGQPAMSGALARLRDVLQDEILVRTGRGMEPTARALALYAQLAPALESIRATLFEQPAFDP